MDVDGKINLAYVIGIALGDGNLSRPNKRATRLRVTCDANYLGVEQEICTALQRLFPNNKISKIKRREDTCFDISVYSNRLDKLMPWKVGCGSKYKQNAHVPKWIIKNDNYIRACLRGLIHTDGSIYLDRGYRMVNFTNNISHLAIEVKNMMEKLGYKPKLYSVNQKSGNLKYTVRLSSNVDKFIGDIDLRKEKILTT